MSCFYSPEGNSYIAYTECVKVFSVSIFIIPFSGDPHLNIFLQNQTGKSREKERKVLDKKGRACFVTNRGWVGHHYTGDIIAKRLDTESATIWQALRVRSVASFIRAKSKAPGMWLPQKKECCVRWGDQTKGVCTTSLNSSCAFLEIHHLKKSWPPNLMCLF